MIYAVAAGFAVGQLVPAEAREFVELWGVVVAGLAGTVALGRQARWRQSPAVTAFGLSVLAGAILTGAVERRPRDVAHIANLQLPWRGELIGIVRGEPIRRPPRTTALVEVERVGSGANARPAHGLVRLTLRRHRALRDGDRVRAWVTLRRPRSFHSPGAFDWAGYLARRGVHVVGSVWDAPAPVRIGRTLGWGSAGVARWRRAAERALVRGVGGPDRHVLAALLLGRGQTLPEPVREQFTRAGVLHVLVVSGLHLTLVAAIATRLAEAVLTRSEFLLLRLDVTRVARLASLLPVAAYLVLVGPSVSVVRAVVATTLAAVATGVGRDAAPWRLWAVASVVVGCVWPGSVHEAAFQLSFASVAGVLLAAGPDAMSRPGHWGRLRQLMNIALAVALVTAPLLALHFDALAPMTVVANPVVVPLFGAAVLGPGLLAAALAPFWCEAAAVLFRTAGWLVQPGLALVRVFGGPLAAPIPVPRPSWLEVAACYALLGGWYGRRRRAWRRAAAVAMCVLAIDAAWWTWERTAPGRLRIAFLDVGQGDAAVVELPDGRVLVVDAGGFPASEFDPGRAVVEPYLRSRKIARLDALVMSHAHPDHAGGLPRLIERFRPREFWWAGTGGEGPAWRAVAEALAGAHVPIRALRRGDAPLPPAGSVTVLHPPYAWSAASLNDSSLVLALRAEGVGVLLTGDVERRAEERLVSGGAGLPLESDVVKVPHHGSRTSSAPGWLAVARPRLAVVSVGAGNAYGLPAAEVLARYRTLGACVLRTDRCGTVVVEARHGALSIETQVAGRACGCAAAQGEAPRPLRNANMTRPTRSRTPSFWKMLVR
jgi:competence protein ComEC